MDPFWEGYLWPDLHHRLATVISDLLTPQIRPSFVARITKYTVMDTHPAEEAGVMYPDVEIFRRNVEEPAAIYANSELPPNFTPVTISISPISPIEVRIPVVEIRDRDDNRLISAVEILSPVNKRKPGLEPYQKKRKQYFESGVHLLEIDLIRRGQRPFDHPELPSSHYLITLVRAGNNPTDFWAFDVQDHLPVVPVPLDDMHDDVVLDLEHAIGLIYERSDYGLSINYKKSPPPPKFNKVDQAWMDQLLKASFP